MPLTIGKHEVTILSHDVRYIGEKEAVSVLVLLPDGDTENVLIFLTEKSMGIARRALRLCGFDPGPQKIRDLVDNPELLKGRRITILAEERNGKVWASVLLNSTPTVNRMAQIDSALRAAKQDSETPIPPAQSTPIAEGQEDESDLPF